MSRDEVANAKRMGLSDPAMWKGLKETRDALEAAELRIQELRAALAMMIGWAKYGEESDPWYFSKDQAPTWEESLNRAEALLSEEKTK